MYKIILINGTDETVIHHYSNAPDAPKLSSATCKFGLNAIPSLTMCISYGNPGFNKLNYITTKAKVVDDTEKVIFEGRLITPDNQLNNSYIYKQVVFEGELGYLKDSIIAPHEWHDYTVKDFLKEVLEEHNKQVDEYKKIYLGDVTVESNLYRLADYDVTFDFLIDRLPSRLGGFFNLRKENGLLYLDYLQDIGVVSKQAIVFGVNLLDFQETYDPSGIFTRLIPLGADKNDANSTSEVGNKLTIKDVNNGIDYIEDKELIKKYGVITVTNTWDDITLPENLLSAAKKYMKENSKPLRSLSMSIADMHALNHEIYDNYNLGDEIPIKCEPLGVDENYKITEMEIDLIDVTGDKNTFTFGNKIGSMTDKQIIMQNSQNKINSFFNDAGLNVNYLNGTINLLKNKMQGMVDVAEKHNELAILFECKVPGDYFGAMALGTKGFMIADELEDDGKTWKWKTFGTAKGFTADLINAGTLSAINLISADGSFKLDLKDGYMSTTGDFLEEKNTLQFGKGQIICNSILRIINIREDTEKPSYILFSHNNNGGSTIVLAATELIFFGDITLHNDLKTFKSITINGDLEVQGNKNCIQQTKNYGDIKFYSVEDTESLLTYTDIDNYFNTEQQQDGTFKIKINIPDVIKECINTEIDYVVNINKFSPGDIWVQEINKDYFIIQSDRQVKFKYTLKGRRKGFENEGLKKEVNV